MLVGICRTNTLENSLMALSKVGQSDAQWTSTNMMAFHNQLPQKLSTILPLCLSSVPSRRVAWYAPILLDLRQHGLGCRVSPFAITFVLFAFLNSGTFEIGESGGCEPAWSALSAGIPVPNRSRFWKPVSMKHRLGMYQVFLSIMMFVSVARVMRSPAERVLAKHLWQGKCNTQFSSLMRHNEEAGLRQMSVRKRYDAG